MLKKIIGGFSALLALIVYSAPARAAGTAYFTLPSDFADNVTSTLVAVAGSVLIVLALMFAWRKTVKSVNRS